VARVTTNVFSWRLKLLKSRAGSRR